MSELSQRFISSALDLAGRPFKQHYGKFVPCSNGIYTDPTCMERGLDLHGEGYDCTGLVITSICRALRVPVRAWPLAYRHTDQLDALAESREPKIGDVIVFNRHGFRAVHVGILIDDDLMLHATDEAGESVQLDPARLKKDDDFISPEVLANVPILGREQAA